MSGNDVDDLIREARVAARAAVAARLRERFEAELLEQVMERLRDGGRAARSGSERVEQRSGGERPAAPGLDDAAERRLGGERRAAPALDDAAEQRSGGERRAAPALDDAVERRLRDDGAASASALNGGGSRPAATAEHPAATAEHPAATAERPAATAERPAAAAAVEHGFWLYCVAHGDHPGVEPVDHGLPGAGPPRLVRAGELVALVSAVPLADFGEEALKRNLNDLEWLESMARAHEAVLDAALRSGAVVPMRVCTIYRDEARVRELLMSRSGELGEALDAVAGRSEWGVKALARRDPRAGADDDPASDGSAYLARKQHERQLREQADARVAEAARRCHMHLAEASNASQLLPPQRRELAGYDGDMVLNAAYLVDDDRALVFRDLVAGLCGKLAGDGITLELTGPWPAYHFAGALVA